MKQSTLAVESVWDYPRPPRLERTPQRIRIIHAGQIIADTALSGDAVRILETSHPPVYYLPRSAIAMQLLSPSRARQSFCEFKGLATYWSLDVAGHDAPEAAWSYESPSPSYAALCGYLAFYATRVDDCWVARSALCLSPAIFMEAGSPPICAARSKAHLSPVTGRASAGIACSSTHPGLGREA